MRFKNRYVLAELVWEDGKCDTTLTGFEVFKALKDCIHFNFGDFGLGSILQSLHVKYFNALTSMCIIRCGRAQHNMVLLALSLLREVRKRRLVVRTLHVSGTIRSCQTHAIDYNKRLVLAMATGSAANANAAAAANAFLGSGERDLKRKAVELEESVAKDVMALES